MGPSEQSPAAHGVSDKDLAAHWDVSRPYIIKLRQQKALPVFADLAEADAWRSVHAPPRGRRLVGKNRGETPTTTPPGTEGAAAASGANEQGQAAGGGGSSANSNGARAADVVDIRKFIRKTDDFDSLALRQAEHAVQIAFGLYERAAGSGDPVEISAALKNWSDASKACAASRAKFLETREKSRALISLDEVEDVVGTELQELRNRLLKQGDRIASALAAVLSAEQLALVKRAIEDDVDAVFAQIEALPLNSRQQILSKAPQQVAS